MFDFAFQTNLKETMLAMYCIAKELGKKSKKVYIIGMSFNVTKGTVSNITVVEEIRQECLIGRRKNG